MNQLQLTMPVTIYAVVGAGFIYSSAHDRENDILFSSDQVVHLRQLRIAGYTANVYMLGL
jgi:hypothetical protein